MSWFVTLIVLALLAWFGYRLAVRGKASGTGPDPLGHDADATGRPLPGQRATTGDAEVEDATRGHVGAHLEPPADPGGAAAPDHGGGTAEPARTAGAAAGAAAAGAAGAAAGAAAPDPAAPGSAATGGDGDMHRVGASVRTEPEPPVGDASVTESFGGDSAPVAVPGDPAPAPDAGGAPTPGGAPPDGASADADVLDPDTAARAADDVADTGGTGAAVLAGIAAAGDAGGPAERPVADADADAAPDTDPEARASAPVAATAGDLDADRADGDAPHPTPAAAGGTPAPDAAATGTRDPARDDARTNAPVGDTDPADAARDPVEPAPASAAAAEAPGAELANPPEPDTAGAGGYRDRSVDARSNLVAGTVTLGVGGATAAAGPAVLEDGDTPTAQAGREDDAAHRERDVERLARVERRDGVREMMKIMNLRDADATRLGISRDDFARLWQRDPAASDALVDDVDAKLRRMLG